ncbi:MAG: type I-F CRISPR-associated protein Csy3 [Candidatus Riflebacteria bacterium GWC2_50_8]|nr:MAG: type I-F CRISPR-associated protein Csy3 [Candidatus Riflebacteria bacterium GWC2_50_8]
MTASVLAFEKKLVPSDGFLYGTTWDKRHIECFPLNLKEKSVRGTISNRLNKKDMNDPAKLDAKVENANLQTVDSCGLDLNQDTLKLSFSLKILSGVEKPSACNDRAFLKNYSDVVLEYIGKYSFKELAGRYALNIANGRVLWRNRVGAENIEVCVEAKNKDLKGQKWVFSANDYSLRDFSRTDKKVDELAELIAASLSGKRDFLMLEIDVYAQIGLAQDVYPSEELVLDKGKGNKSKILYSIDDIAAMHSQKIGNAIRTIDTWYPEFAEVKTGPIAAEPYGAVTNLGVAYRKPKDKSDFFTLFDKYAAKNKLENEEQEHYVMAVLVRGGVFGESDKE